MRSSALTDRLLGAMLSIVVLAGLTGCTGDGEPSFDTVDELFVAAGGEAWCGDELRVTLAPFVGNCGDASTDARVVLGVGSGGEELRASVAAARENLTGDGQLLLVPSDPDRASGWQLRSRDQSLLEAAQAELGGLLLDDGPAIDAWLER